MTAVIALHSQVRFWSTCYLYRVTIHTPMRSSLLAVPQTWLSTTVTTRQPPPQPPQQPPPQPRIPNELAPPTILYSSNHLLLVNKPAGWHSVPNQRTTNETTTAVADSNNNKCLLTYLQQQRLGGGSQQTFLLPCHRLDQPCTGVLLFAKTRRMASRIQSHWSSSSSSWNGAMIQKTYLCVVESDRLRRLALYQRSRQTKKERGEEGEWRELQGILQASRRRGRSGGGWNRWSDSLSTSPRGWSVTMIPVTDNSNSNALDVDSNQNHHSRCNDKKKDRICSIRYRPLLETTTTHHHDDDDDDDDDGRQLCLLQVQTNDGARHVIRALLAMADCPIVGDVRYGSCSRRHVLPIAQTTRQQHHQRRNRRGGGLPDRSVALHARSLELSDRLLPSSLSSGGGQTTFCAPLPDTWMTYFGWSESDVQAVLSENPIIEGGGRIH